MNNVGLSVGLISMWYSVKCHYVNKTLQICLITYVLFTYIGAVAA